MWRWRRLSWKTKLSWRVLDRSGMVTHKHITPSSLRPKHVTLRSGGGPAHTRIIQSLPNPRRDCLSNAGEPQLQLHTFSFRLAVICLVSASVGLSMAIISVAKLLLFLTAGFALLFSKSLRANAKAVLQAHTVLWVLLALTAFAASLAWSVAPDIEAFGSLAKYGKLLTVILLVALIKDRREALYALGTFALAQTFLVASSWMLFFDLSVPWATSRIALRENSVFSSYLDQGIMAAVFSGICWHLRDLAPSRGWRSVVMGVSVLSLLNAVFVLNGRSGHMVAIAIVSIAVMWKIPRKFRLGVLFIPPVLLAVLMLASPKVQERAKLVVTEVQSYTKHPEIETDTSSGVRLRLWGTALASITQHPVAGSGVGSWSSEYNRLQRQRNPLHKDIEGNGNPHQEYLQWGVQLGLPGLVLLLAFFVAVLRDSMTMDTATSRALQTVVLALAVACLFNSSIYDALIGDFFCVAIGLLMALGLRPIASPYKNYASQYPPV